MTAFIVTLSTPGRASLIVENNKVAMIQEGEEPRTVTMDESINFIAGVKIDNWRVHLLTDDNSVYVVHSFAWPSMTVELVHRRVI